MSFFPVYPGANLVMTYLPKMHPRLYKGFLQGSEEPYEKAHGAFDCEKS